MTAEVAVMNKEAIALAADSAVTSRHSSGGQKIFVSANKIFTLSKYAPVGVMVYGNAQFMNVPWETIVKIYRAKLGKGQFPTLKQYAEDFLAWLENATTTLFPEGQQDGYVELAVYRTFSRIRDQINRVVEKQIKSKGEISEDEVKDLVSSTLKIHLERWQKADRLPTFPVGFEAEIVEKYKATIDKVRTEVFEKLLLSDENVSCLEELTGLLFTKWVRELVSRSGIVFAGYGRNEFFPSLYDYLLEGIVSNRLKYRFRDESGCTHENDAIIVPFAQREMVDTFVQGTDPGLAYEIDQYVQEVIDDYPSLVIDSIEELTPERKEELKNKFNLVSAKRLKEYREKFDEYKRENFIDPVVDVVGILPKDELAALAESFVNLTSLKRRISPDQEMVGGPIDVAVISKGDGFIWIKRKHYFSRELDPQFFANYFREVADEEA